MLGNLDRGGTSKLRLWRQRRTLWAQKAGVVANNKVYADVVIKVIITYNDETSKESSHL